MDKNSPRQHETVEEPRRSLMTGLGGKVAVVTGASKGICAAIAKSLGEAGAAVAVNYFSSKEGAHRVVADIEACGGRAIAVRGGVTERIGRLIARRNL
jgi:3-oxoacyl-[acyl-carrier protein] reductase